MAAYARLVVLLLTAVMGLSPWAGTRELRQEAEASGIEGHVSRPEGDSIAINRGEKHRGVHRQRLASPGIDPVSETDDDDVAPVDLALSTGAPVAWDEPALLPSEASPRATQIVGAHSCRGPPARA